MFATDRPDHLLTLSNPKILKSKARGHLTGILHLAPHTISGTNVCPASSAAGCRESCLNTAGRGRFTQVQQARLRKTKLLFEERAWFMRQLHQDIEALLRKCDREGFLPAVRLNGTSDIDWQKIPYLHGNITHKNIFQAFPLLQFYDYTKYLPPSKEANYHLTFSYSGEPKFARFVRKALEYEMNIAVVFRDQLPATFMDMPVVSGEESDLRFLDPDGCVIGLEAKGSAIKETGPFVVDHEEFPQQLILQVM